MFTGGTGPLLSFVYRISELIFAFQGSLEIWRLTPLVFGWSSQQICVGL